MRSTLDARIFSSNDNYRTIRSFTKTDKMTLLTNNSIAIWLDGAIIDTIELYVVVNEKIEKDDWYIVNGFLKRCTDSVVYSGDSKYVKDTLGNTDHIQYCAKIVATTDSALNNEGVPFISRSYLLFYINQFNNGISIVDAKIELAFRSNAALGHKEYVYLEHVEEDRFIVTKIDAHIDQTSYTVGDEEEFQEYELESFIKVNTDRSITIKRGDVLTLIRSLQTRQDLFNVLLEMEKEGLLSLWHPIIDKWVTNE